MNKRNQRIRIAPISLFLMFFFKVLAAPGYIHQAEIDTCYEGHNEDDCPICHFIFLTHSTSFDACEKISPKPIITEVFDESLIISTILYNNPSGIIFFNRPPPYSTI